MVIVLSFHREQSCQAILYCVIQREVITRTFLYPCPYSKCAQSYCLLLRSRSLTATATAETTTELRLEVTGGAALTLLAGITSSVAVAVATSTAAATAALTVVATHHATRGSVGALLLDVRLRHNLGREVEPLAEVVKTLRGEGVVVVLP